MNIDEAIWQSAQNLLLSTPNLDKLWDALDTIQCNHTKIMTIDYHNEAEEDSGWIYPVWEKYYKVKQSPNGRMKEAGWITLAIQLTCAVGMEGDWPHGNRSKVLVGYSSSKDYDDTWEFDSDSPNSAGYYEDCDTEDYLWRFSGETSWFYAVPLSVLTSTDDVDDYIVKPTHRMIKGESAAVVLGAIADKLCVPPRI